MVRPHANFAGYCGWESWNKNFTYLWRNSTYILANPTYVSELKKQIEEFFLFNKDGFSSIFNLWCSHKAFIRGILIHLASGEKKEKNYYLLSQISHLEGLHKQNLQDSILPKLKSLRGELKTALVVDHDKIIKRLQLSSYSPRDKAGKSLAF